MVNHTAVHYTKTDGLIYNDSNTSNKEVYIDKSLQCALELVKKNNTVISQLLK
jgi:hypothetical protein